MLLLSLIVLDFGRVYLGWINLQSMARAAGNFAANNSEAWLTPNDTATIAEYRNQVLNDATATNCKLVTTDPNDASTVPSPTFSDGNGDGTTTSIGDRVTASFTCQFGVITPIISSILGNTVNVSASAMFPIKTGQFATSGGSGPVADFTGTPTNTTTGTNVVFTDTSTGAPTSWTWTFGDGASSTAQNPMHAYSAAGTYTVALTVGNASGISTFTRTDYVTVTSGSPVASFTANSTAVTVGTTVTFTATSTGSPTNYAWTFGDGGSISGPGAVASHAYNTAGTYTVTLVVTTGSGNTTVTRTNYIVVSVATCQVPTFIGTSSAAAQSTWAAAGFTTNVKFKQGGTPWTIQSQDVVANSSAPCNTVVTVSRN
jgi:PKD repeat protein